jgi:serine/threonine-protein kinase
MENQGSRRKFGRYEIVAELGRGAMGIVYQARDPQIGRMVALKTVSLRGQEPEEQQEFRQRFLREAQAAGRLQHSGLVAIYDAGEDQESHDPYIVLEYVPGDTLHRILAREKKLPLPQALQLAEEIAQALDYAHTQGVVHRDIKPANILITEDGHAKIADFGIARLNLAHFTVPGQVLGTPAYMAPEQLTGEGVDSRSDIFSLGVLLYAMVTGHSPFQGNSATTVCFKVVNREPLPASALDMDLPRALDGVISRAMAKDPTQRFQRGSDLARALRDLRDAPPVPDSLPVLSALQSASASAKVEPKNHGETTGKEDTRRAETRAAKTTSDVTASVAQPAVPIRYLVACAALLVLAVAVGISVKHARTSQAAATVGVATPLRKSSVPDAEASREKPPEAIPPAAQVSSAPTADTVPTPAAHTRPTQAPGHHPATKASAAAHSPSHNLPNPAVVSPAPTSTLQLAVVHQFKDATLFVWVDDQLALTRPLHGESRKRLIVFPGTRGTDLETLQLPAGTHQLRVRAQSSDLSIDLSKTISADLAPDSDKTLQVTFEKHNTLMRLVWR